MYQGSRHRAKDSSDVFIKEGKCGKDINRTALEKRNIHNQGYQEQGYLYGIVHILNSIIVVIGGEKPFIVLHCARRGYRKYI